MGFASPNYTQTPNDFFKMLPDMSEVELRVTLVMIRQTFGFHRDGFKMGVGKMATAAGLSRQGVLNGAAEAEKRGTFRRSNPDAQGEAEWELVVDPLYAVDTPLQTVEGTPPSGGGQVRVKEREKKEIKAGVPVEWRIAHGEEVTQEDVDSTRLPTEAQNQFETALGFGTLPWSSNSTWEKFGKFVTKLYQGCPSVFMDYKQWREGPGKYSAMSNRKIRENPQMFMDTGYPEFEASKMYSQPKARAL